MHRYSRKEGRLYAKICYAWFDKPKNGKDIKYFSFIYFFITVTGAVNIVKDENTKNCLRKTMMRHDEVIKRVI